MSFYTLRSIHKSVSCNLNKVSSNHLKIEEFLVFLKKGPEEFNKWIAELGPYGMRPMYVEFEKHDFEDFSFSEYKLDLILEFKNCTFTHANPFRGISSVGSIRFRNCKQLPNLEFGSCRIGGIAIYDCAEINEFTIMDSTVTGTIDIRNAVILNQFNVQQSNFIKEKTFAPCLLVDNLVVNGDSCFDDSIFDVYFQLYNCKFKGLFSAKNIKYGGRPIFTKSEFFDLTDFRDSVFTRPPHFNGSELHQHTIFPEAKNFLVTKKTKTDDIRKDIDAIRILKVHSSKLMDRRQQVLFHSLEHQYLIKSGAIKGFEKLVSKLYSLFSDYGVNLLKPILFLLGFIVFFGILYSSLLSTAINFNYDFDWNIINKGFKQSLESAFLPFRVLLKEDIKLSITLLSILQSVFSIIWIGLFGLALRWNFKRD